MHRDLKPENVLASASPVQAVIIDFGCATWAKSSNNHMQGTIRYLAPEVIAIKDRIAPLGTYDNSADVWSMGITAHELLHGSRIRWQKICRATFQDDLLPRLEAQAPAESAAWAFEVVRQMLQWQPGKRITSQQAYRSIPQPERSDISSSPTHRKRQKQA